GPTSPWLVHLDYRGNYIGQSSFVGNSSHVIRALQQTSDGGLILAGDEDGVSGWATRQGTNGSSIWTRTFGGTGVHQEKFTSVQQTADGGYILAGYSSSTPSGQKTAQLYG